MKNPILGQEAIVPLYGIGRITSFNIKKKTINVETYVGGVIREYDSDNVTFVKDLTLKNNHIFSEYIGTKILKAIRKVEEFYPRYYDTLGREETQAWEELNKITNELKDYIKED